MATQETLMDFEIVTPEGKFFSGQVTQVDIPGKDGYFGVLPNHIPLISSLAAGVLTVDPTLPSQQQFYVSEGFAEVTNQRCTVLASYVINLASITKDEALKNLEAISFSISTTIDTDKLALLKLQQEHINGVIKALA